jgi:cyanate lyase
MVRMHARRAPCLSALDAAQIGQFSVYGSTIKELIHEEFGDGIMSAIDFKMDIVREADPKGDRVTITMNGKFLPYKTY